MGVPKWVARRTQSSIRHRSAFSPRSRVASQLRDLPIASATSAWDWRVRARSARTHPDSSLSMSQYP